MKRRETILRKLSGGIKKSQIKCEGKKSDKGAKGEWQEELAAWKKGENKPYGPI